MPRLAIITSVTKEANMTREEIVKGMRIHIDQFVDCSNCPLEDVPGCFEKLAKEAIALLEKEADNEQ